MMFLLFISTCLLAFYIDLKLWRTFTPTIITYSGVFLIILSHWFLGPVLGFINIDESVYLYLVSFIVISIISSVVSYILYPRLQFKENSNNGKDTFYNDKENRVVVLFGFLIACVCIFYVAKSWLTLGSLVSEEFEGLLTYGIAGHSFALLVATLPFLFKAFRKNKNILVLLLVLLVYFLLFMKQVKYWVMIPLVWMIWYSIRTGFFKVNIFKTIFLCIFVALTLFVLFFLVYFMKVVLSSQGSDVDYSRLVYDITIHFFGYLFSGVLTFSSYIEQGMFSSLKINDVWGLFSGPLNVINVLTSNDLLSLNITRPFVTLNPGTSTVGNVPTLWGTMLIAGGYIGFVIYFFIMLFMYFLQWCSDYSKLALINYTFLSSFLFFSWFDYYYYLLMPFEVAVFICMLYIIFEVKFFNAIVFRAPEGKSVI
ncbi:DUF6337 family protein [Pantoea wallisii]|uniref:DUF6337 family protein n=1 Tax=Pantoea wallisii TaxID=1076551 RepID=UPI000FFB6BFE|nr:DUF6337 family protein [Pantoea wallisii]